MPYVSEFYVSLRIRLLDNSLDIEQIAKEIGMTPGRFWRKDEPRVTPKGEPLPGTYDCSYCYFDLQRQPEEQLCEMIERCCADLTEYAPLLREIKDAGGTIEFFISWVSPDNTGEIFPSELLLQLGQLGIQLALDVYGSTSEEEAE